MKISHAHSGTRRGEQGNVLFYILVAVSLLAALSYAVSQSNRGSTNALTEEKTKLLASEIIEYGNVMSNAVAQLRLRGVKPESMCFNDPAWGADDYDHAGCTDDFNKIYSPSGAGLNWAQPSTMAMDSTATPDNLWHIYGDNEVDRIGLTCGTAECADLILVADELNRSVCLKLNDILGVANPADEPPTISTIGTARYKGSFGYAQTIGGNLSEKSAGCFKKTTNPAKYTFYKVLLAR